MRTLAITAMLAAICVLASAAGANAGTNCPITRFNLQNDERSLFDIVAVKTPPKDHNWLAGADQSNLKPRQGIELKIAWPHQCECNVTLQIVWAKKETDDIMETDDIKASFCQKFGTLVVKPGTYRFDP